MKKSWLILILWITVVLTAHSQPEKCYQTVQLHCGDTIVDYLTAQEKRNLFKLQVKLEQYKNELEYLRAAAGIDSARIVSLSQTATDLTTTTQAALEAKKYCDVSYGQIMDGYKALQRRMRANKVKAWAGGVAGGLGAFGAGVGITFLVLKLQ